MMDQQSFEATRPVSADPAVALAEALGVTTEALSGWFTGVDVPLNIYFSALDIVAIGSLGSANFKS